MDRALLSRKSVTTHRFALWRTLQRHWLDYLCIAPFFISFLVFSLYPFIWSIVLSFSYWRGFGPMQWVGFDNYRAMFQDRYFFQSLFNTIIFALLLLPSGILLSVLFAVLLNNTWLKGRGVFRTIYFLPFLTSAVVVSLVFLQLFDDSLGWINYWFQAIGLSPVRWLRGDVWGGRIVIVLLATWAGLGYNILLVLGGLQSISPEVNEAARIDGASEWSLFWRITLPLLRPILLFMIITGTIGLIGLFDPVFMLTKGGPDGATRTMMYRQYEIAFLGSGRIGDATAFGFIVGLIILGITVFQLRYLRLKD